MKKTLIFLLAVCPPLFADEDRFREQFADPATRTAALSELIPGTRDAYFHTALDHQLAGRDADFRKTLTDWKTAADRKDSNVSTEGYVILENRQLLMDYQKAPESSLAELIRRLNLEFDDARPDAEAAENLPTLVDAALIAEVKFEAEAAKKVPARPHTEYRGPRLFRELERVESFDEPKIRWFLENLERADLPGVVPLIDRSLSLEKPVTFGSVGLHSQLNSSQLQTLLELHPDLKSNETFAIAYLTRLRPGSETDFDRDTAAHAMHLERCREFALTLPPALNSLKAHVLFHHLRLQAELGKYPKGDFLAFLGLPRMRHEILRIHEKESLAYIKFDADFSEATACHPMEEDLPLIQSHLRHYLGQTDSAAEFAPFIGEKPLARLHARARLLSGSAVDRWGYLLDPAEFKALQEEAFIRFAPGAPILLDSDDPVSLKLDLKNTPDLLVRIYEIDLPAHLVRHGREPEVSINLDGLVPHHERRLAFAQSPIVQHQENIALPELAGPGVWLVDFVSGQVSARTLIRKGSLVPFVERGASGQSVRVFDENGNLVTNAEISLGLETHRTDTSGRIHIPDAPNQPVTTGVVTSGKLAAPVQLGRRSESLKLDARFHLEREQLLADREARLQLRVRLSNHGYEVPLERINNPTLVLKAELLGGVITERVIVENSLLKSVMEVPFQVPADLLSLSFTLSGTVTPATGGEPVKLREHAIYQINRDLLNSRVATAFFSPTQEGLRLEVRGRNGEPMPSRAITLEVRRDDYRSPIRLQVRTDDDGRVELGKLPGIDQIQASGTDIQKAIYKMQSRSLDHTASLHLLSNSEIRLPLEQPAAAPDRLALSLIETVANQPVRDHFDKIAINDGWLIIRDLPPGDHRLTQSSNTTLIRVSSGSRKDDLLVSNTRVLPYHSPRNPVIAAASTVGDELKLQLRNHGPGTRITVIGKRFHHPEWNAGFGLHPFAPRIPDTLMPGFNAWGYLTDRLLGDEMRYILDRRAATPFPGVMLPRPSRLLNRWTAEDLDQSLTDGRSGDTGQERAPASRGSAGAAAPTSDRGGNTRSVMPVICDFLEKSAVVRFDLSPADDGSLQVPLADFKGCQFIEIVATDAFASDTLRLPLPATDTPLRDRRIARPLDPETRYQATRSAAVLAKDATASIENLLDADWRAFTNVAEVHQFLYGMNNDDRLREFVFLTEWPDFTEARKLELLSNHACHELHLFLARKDKVFFEKFVKPLLAEKPEPQFIDDLLLERDLTRYLRPYAWQRLNAAEKALLARALPDATERISRELSLRWELEAPAPDAEALLFTRTLRGGDLAMEDSFGMARNRSGSVGGNAGMASGTSYVTEKLRRIVIPEINFQDTTLAEAVEFLRLRSMELDTLELDPARKGVNFVIRNAGGASDDDGAFSGDPGGVRIKELRVRNVPLNEAMKYITEATRFRFKVDDYAVTLVPATESGDDLLTRTFQVPPDFLALLSNEDSPRGEVDPFAEPSGSTARLASRKPAIELLRQNGISFSEGTSATLSSSGILLVTNTPTELDKLEQLTSALKSSSDEGLDAAASGGFDAIPSDGLDMLDPMLLPPINGDPFENAGASTAMLKVRPPLFPDRTKLWRESNYYRNTAATDESLIPLNRFWLDLAAWDGEGAFLSPHFNACNTTANEALMCLALLDIPFKADRPEVSVDGSMLRVKAREPMLLFYKDTRRADVVAEESPLLVRQSFSPLAEKFLTVNGRREENPVTGDFRPGVPYSASLIVTNPTGIGRRLEILAQIPAGSIPLEGKPATLSSTVEIEPHGVLKLELAFYFPAVGDFTIYPLTVSEGGVVLAHTARRMLKVSDAAEPQDAASWLVLAADGSEEEVITRLRTVNLDTVELKAIRWRLKNKGFFLEVSRLLRERLHFSPTVSSFGFLHNDAASLREYLENSAAVRQLGQWLDSPLLDVRPLEHHDWQTLDFDPLINPRAHRFTSQSRINHEAARGHYHAFLDQLAWKPALDDSDYLGLAVLLLLQDRVAEGLEMFDRINPANLPGAVPAIYTYLLAVTRFHRGDPQSAKTAADKVLPTLPPGKWRERFQAVVDQAEEIASFQVDDEIAKPLEEAVMPQLDLALGDDGRLAIRHRALETVTLRMFSVDLEVMFSKNPFLRAGIDGEGNPAIRPNEVITLDLAKDQQETFTELPETLRRGSVLVAAESGDTKLLKVLDPRTMELKRIPQMREIQVLDATTRRPLVKTYIKVYAETRGGDVVFHKDGYSDLRGKFDYLSHTGADPSHIRRVALFASHPERGARVVIYDL